MTLYRKYRPQTFAETVNQDPIKTTIQNQILTNRVSHAYLFTGPRGVGKTTFARLLAKALNCENRTEKSFEPCNKCISCVEITKGISLDLIEQDAASNRGIDEIRSLKYTVRIAPSRSKFKIFIIDEVHMLTIPAFNALLKTLEEPPENTIFILATTEPHKLPETIISRCQRFDFKKIQEGELVALLSKISKQENVKVAKDILVSVAIRSEGCVRDALSIFGKIITIGTGIGDKEITWQEAELVIPRSDKKMVAKFAGYLENGSAFEAIELIQSLVQEGMRLEQFFLELIDFVRDKMIAALYNKEFVNIEKYKIIIDILITRYNNIKRTSYLPQLPLELAVVDCFSKFYKGREANSHVPESKPESTPKLVLKPEPAQEPSMPTVSKSSSINIEHIKKKWDQVLKKVKAYNHSLPVALSECEPISTDGNRLNLGFKFKLHYSTVTGNQKNRAVLEAVLQEVFGEKILVEGEVLEETENVVLKKEGEDTAQNVKEVFG